MVLVSLRVLGVHVDADDVRPGEVGDAAVVEDERQGRGLAVPEVVHQLEDVIIGHGLYLDTVVRVGGVEGYLHRPMTFLAAARASCSVHGTRSSVILTGFHLPLASNTSANWSGCFLTGWSSSVR